MNHEEIQRLVRSEDYEQVIKVLESQLIETTQSVDLTNLLIKSYNEFAIELLDQSQPMLALEVLKKAENFTDVSAELRSRTFNNIACCYKVQNKYILALKYIEKAIFLHSAGDLHLNKCAILSMTGKHNKALEEAMFAVIYIQEEMLGDFLRNQEMNIKKCETLAISYHNLAVELEFMKKAPESIEFYTKALNYCEHFSEIDKKLQEKLEIDMKMALKAVQKHSHKAQEPGFRVNSKKKRIIIKNSRSKSPVLRSQNTPIKRSDVQEPKKVIGRKFVNTGIKKEKMIELRKTQTFKKEDSETEENFTRTERIFIRESEANEDKTQEIRTNEDDQLDHQGKSEKILPNEEDEEKYSEYSSLKKNTSKDHSSKAKHRAQSKLKDSSESENQNSDKEREDGELSEGKLLTKKTSINKSVRKSEGKVEINEKHSEHYSIESNASSSSKLSEIKSSNSRNDSVVFKGSEVSGNAVKIKDDSAYKEKIPDEETEPKNLSGYSSLHSLPSDYKRAMEAQSDSKKTSEKSKKSIRKSSSSFESRHEEPKWASIEQKAKDSFCKASDENENSLKTLKNSEKSGGGSKVSQEKNVMSSEKMKKKNSNSSLRLLVERKSENEHEENQESQSRSSLKEKSAKFSSRKEGETEHYLNSDTSNESKARLKSANKEGSEKINQSDRISCQLYEKDSKDNSSSSFSNKKLNSDPVRPYRTTNEVKNDSGALKNLNLEAEVSKSSDSELKKSEKSVSSSNKLLSKSPSHSSKNQPKPDRNKSISSKSPISKNSSGLNKNENSPSKRSSLISKSSIKSDKSEKNQITTEKQLSLHSKNQSSSNKDSLKSKESSLKSPLLPEKLSSSKNSGKSPIKSESSSKKASLESLKPEQKSLYTENHPQSSHKSSIKSLKPSEKPENSYKNSSVSEKSPLIQDKTLSSSSKNPSLSNLPISSKKSSSLSQSNKFQESQHSPDLNKGSSDMKIQEKLKFKGLLIQTSFYESDEEPGLSSPSRISENAEFFYVEESSKAFKYDKISLYSDKPSIQDSLAKDPDGYSEKDLNEVKESKSSGSLKKDKELSMKLNKNSNDSVIFKIDSNKYSSLPQSAEQVVLCKSIIYSIVTQIFNP